MNHDKDFSKKTNSQLEKKGILIIGTQAITAFEGDKCFTSVAYILSYNGTGFIRSHSQVIVLAKSSWNPAINL